MRKRLFLTSTILAATTSSMHCFADQFSPFIDRIDTLIKQHTPADQENIKSTLRVIVQSVNYTQLSENEYVLIQDLQKYLFPEKNDRAIQAAASGTYQIVVLDAINTYRRKNGLNTLNNNETLHKIAQDYAEQLASHEILSHTGPDGSTLASRIREGGYLFMVAGENLAFGYEPMDSERLVADRFKSASHQSNIINETFTESGLGYSQGYWVHVFGKPLNS